MTSPSYADVILGACQPLDPRPTGVETKLGPLAGIRAVLFDVYGTLMISASGDIGANAGDHRLEALKTTCDLFQLKLDTTPKQALEIFEDEIRASHAKSRAAGIEFPEVDIVEIWQATLPRTTSGEHANVDHSRFALEYEVRVNPVWPMPGIEQTLADLSNSERVLGIVSNAQFFTPLLFPALLGESVEEFGFLPGLLYFSYEYQQAKPGNYLYGLARKQLESQGIRPAEVLYVGNDMLNDIAAAASVGFRTALFAGDERSLRWRADDERVQDIVPELVITELRQLSKCLV